MKGSVRSVEGENRGVSRLCKAIGGFEGGSFDMIKLGGSVVDGQRGIFYLS